MADIRDISDTAWANVTLAADEVWQCKVGEVLVSVTDPGADATQGIVLSGKEKDGIQIASGKTVYYRRISPYDAVIAREAT